MTVQNDIETILATHLSPTYLDVLNESDQHNVPANSETHFRVVVASAEFDAQRKVARHQRIYALLAAQLEGPVHALALHTHTPAEWAARNEQVNASPECLGGSKND